MEIAMSKNNKQIGKGSIAVNDKYNKDLTYFFNFVAFGKTAEIMSKYLKKGSQVGLTYSLSQNRWQDKEGKNRSSIELIVNEFTFVGGQSEKPTNQSPQQTGQQAPSINFDNFDTEPMGNDELPFGRI
jgi:single-strand DNA-binding protein